MSNAAGDDPYFVWVGAIEVYQVAILDGVGGDQTVGGGDGSALALDAQVGSISALLRATVFLSRPRVWNIWMRGTFHMRRRRAPTQPDSQ